MIIITRVRMNWIIIPSITLLLLAATPMAVKADTGWYAAYWNNTALTGPPVITRMENQLNHHWGYGSPDVRVQPDYFAARWSRELYLTPGRYRFTATTDDGVRVWVNGALILNAWYEHAAMTISNEVDVPQGSTLIVVEYFEQAGVAEAFLTWQPVGPPPGPPPAPQPGPSGPYTAYVLADHLNVRSGPAVGYAVVTVTSRGTTVTLTHRNADASWVRVLLPSGVYGWVNAYYLASNLKPFTFLPIGDHPYPPPPVATARVWVAYLNMRSGPGVRYYVVTVLVRDETVTLTGYRSGGWVQVRTQQGLVGWVNGYYLR